jgi:serine/threonine protein kinase
VVYRAYDEVLHHDVALKVVKKGAGLDPSVGRRLLHEARASSSLAHQNRDAPRSVPNVSSCKIIGDYTALITVQKMAGRCQRSAVGFWFRHDHAPEKSQQRVYSSS